MSFGMAILSCIGIFIVLLFFNVFAFKQHNDSSSCKDYKSSGDDEPDYFHISAFSDPDSFADACGDAFSSRIAAKDYWLRHHH